jgi:DNA-binding transcriptional ArsR family regulator
METKHAVAVLDALSDETRLETIQMLVAAGADGLPAGVIAERLGRLPSSLTFHLQHLDRAGLVSQRRVGRQIIYSAETAKVADVVGYLTANCGGTNSSAKSAGCQDSFSPSQNWFWR